MGEKRAFLHVPAAWAAEKKWNTWRPCTWSLGSCWAVGWLARGCRQARCEGCRPNPWPGAPRAGRASRRHQTLSWGGVLGDWALCMSWWCPPLLKMNVLGMETCGQETASHSIYNCFCLVQGPERDGLSIQRIRWTDIKIGAKVWNVKTFLQKSTPEHLSEIEHSTPYIHNFFSPRRYKILFVIKTQCNLMLQRDEYVDTKLIVKVPIKLRNNKKDQFLFQINKH